MPYLTPSDPHAFDDYPLAPVPPPEYGFSDEKCPTCQGHGGWNLEVNAYPLHQYENTPENRHLYSHFRTSCGSCWGWGYLRKGQTCAHEWKHGRGLGKCLTMWVCVKCGAECEVDSSD